MRLELSILALYTVILIRKTTNVNSGSVFGDMWYERDSFALRTNLQLGENDNQYSYPTATALDREKTMYELDNMIAKYGTDRIVCCYLYWLDIQTCNSGSVISRKKDLLMTKVFCSYF